MNKKRPHINQNHIFDFDDVFEEDLKPILYGRELVRRLSAEIPGGQRLKIEKLGELLGVSNSSKLSERIPKSPRTIYAWENPKTYPRVIKKIKAYSPEGDPLYDPFDHSNHEKQYWKYLDKLNLIAISFTPIDTFGLDNCLITNGDIVLTKLEAEFAQGWMHVFNDPEGDKVDLISQYFVIREQAMRCKVGVAPKHSLGIFYNEEIYLEIGAVEVSADVGYKDWGDLGIYGYDFILLKNLCPWEDNGFLYRKAIETEIRLSESITEGLSETAQRELESEGKLPQLPNILPVILGLVHDIPTSIPKRFDTKSFILEATEQLKLPYYYSFWDKETQTIKYCFEKPEIEIAQHKKLFEHSKTWRNLVSANFGVEKEIREHSQIQLASAGSDTLVQTFLHEQEYIDEQINNWKD